MTRPLIILLLSLSFSVVGLPAGATHIQKHQERLSLAREMANMTLTMVSDPSKKQAERLESLKRGFANIVDTNWIARFVIGNAWRKANDEERSRYTTLYQQFLMQTYISTYAQDETSKITDIRVVDVKDEADDNFTTRTEVKLSNARKITVDYLVKPDGDGYKIIDVIIEGISLLSTHRNEFTQIAARGGVGDVIRKLEKLTAVN